jgi:hypothetical protein
MGLDKGRLRLGVVRPPDDYANWLSDVWNGIDVVTVAKADKLTATDYDIVHMFTYDRRQLEAEISCAIAAAANPRGAVWISWPKKASKLFVDVTEDTIRAVVLPLDWVDVKVSAVSDIWSGLKFLRHT